MNNQDNLLTLKNEIIKTSYLLKNSPIKLQSFRLSVLQNLHKHLEASKSSLPSFVPELEELALLLILRTTTTLEKVRCAAISEVTRQILVMLKDFNFTELVKTGVAEFLETPSSTLTEEQVIKSEINELSIHLRTLQERMNNNYPKKQMAIEQRVSETTKEASVEVKREHQDIVRRIEFSSEIERANSSSVGASESQVEVKQEAEEKKPGLPMNLTERKSFSICILDIKGNFIIADKFAEHIFEMKNEELIKSNIFDHMIPLSKMYLYKTTGGSLFPSKQSQTKTFKWTIYSKRATKKYQKMISTFEKKDKSEVKRFVENQKISEEEKALMHEDSGIYYKYLQTLVSKATLIELKFAKIEDMVSIGGMENVNIKVEDELFKEPNKDGTISKPAVLLLTKKARHIQRFRYPLMEQHDKKIIMLENRVKNKVSKLRKKAEKKEKEFLEKVEFNDILRKSKKKQQQQEIFLEEEEEEEVYF